MNMPKRHSLAKDQKGIVFVDDQGEELAMSAATNPLTGSYMYWFSDSSSMYIGTKREVKKIVVAIVNEKDYKVLYNSFK